MRLYLTAGAVFLTAVLGTDRGVTERSLPAWFTVTGERTITGAVLTAWSGGAVTAVRPGVSLTALTLARGHTDPAQQLTLPVALRLVAEHPGPAGLTATLEALGAAAVETAGQSEAVPAAGPRVAEVTLALTRGQTVAVLRVALGATDRHLAEVSYPAVQALDLALTGADIPGLICQAASTAGLLFPATSFTSSRAGDHQGDQQGEQEEQHGGGGGGD